MFPPPRTQKEDVVAMVVWGFRKKPAVTFRIAIAGITFTLLLILVLFLTPAHG